MNTRASTAFAQAAARYTHQQCVLGKSFKRESWVIGQLGRFLSKGGAQDLDGPKFDAWCRTRCHTSPNSRRGEALIVRKFCLYRRRTEPSCFVPDSLHFPRRVQPQPPVLLCSADIVRILSGIDGMPHHPQFPLRRPVLRIAVILLYTTGLRRQELVSFRLNDVDLVNRTLLVRDSKFHKSRIIPMNATVSRELRAFMKVRLASPWDISPSAPLLGHHHGYVTFRAYTPHGLSSALKEVFTMTGVGDGHGRQPRLHDFRHSFAVQALLRWYRAGADVQAKLPQLSMYMGHVSIASTAYYLHLIPEIAAAANRRFARHFGRVAQGGAR